MFLFFLSQINYNRKISSRTLRNYPQTFKNDSLYPGETSTSEASNIVTYPLEPLWYDFTK